MQDRNNTIWLPSCHSTNTYVKEWLINNRSVSGWTVSTYEQTAGRGQMGNIWESEPYKNLTFSSFYIFDLFEVKDLFFLSMAVSLAVAELLETFEIKGEIKWPNDIYAGKEKICGLLIEPHIQSSHVKHAVIGVGLNVNQKKFKTSCATSIFLLKGEELQLETLLETLLTLIDEKVEMVKMNLFNRLKQDYYKYLYLKDKPAAFKSKDNIFMGIVRGVDDFGRLQIETENEQMVFSNKEIQFLR